MSVSRQRAFCLDGELLDTLATHAVTRSYPRNTVLVTEGDETNAIYIVLEGRVRVYVADEQGREVTLNSHGPGEYFGEMTLDGGPRSASVMTTEPSRFLIVPRASLEALFAARPDFAVHLLVKLIHRVRVLTERVKRLSLEDVYGRFRALVEELAMDEDGIKVVPERLTQADIASRIGASREMVSRILTQLSVGGYVERRQGRLAVLKRLPADW